MTRATGLALAAAVAAVLHAAPVAAQRPAPTAVLNGTVWDSLAGRPLAGAEVTVGSVARTRTDAQGRFSVRAPAGEYAVGFTHSSLSDWGVLRHPVTLRLEDGRTVSVALATASEATARGRLCAEEHAAVGGLVRDLLTLVPLGGVGVAVETPEGVGPRGMMLTTGGDGSWHACVPPGSLVEARARFGEVRSRPVRLGGDGLLSVHDIYLQASEPAELQGEVRDGENGTPLAGAAVQVQGSRLQTITGDDGRFRFRGVPPGVVRLSVERLGYGRREAMVRAEGGSTARVTLELFAEAIAMDSMVVTVEGGVIDRASLPTRFDGLSRAEIDAMLHRVVTFSDLLRNANIPGLRVGRTLRQSAGGMRLSALCVETARRSSQSQESCQMVEVYLNDARIADPELLLETLDPTTIDRIQLLSATQAGTQYMNTPRSRNGILLIWTRRR